MCIRYHTHEQTPTTNHNAPFCVHIRSDLFWDNYQCSTQHTHTQTPRDKSALTPAVSYILQPPHTHVLLLLNMTDMMATFIKHVHLYMKSLVTKRNKSVKKMFL